MSIVIEGVYKQTGQSDTVLPLLVDSTGRLVVSGGGGGGGSTIDRELVVSTYRCKTAFTGASTGDTITSTQIIDVTETPVTVSTIWRNQTTATDLASVPSAANLELVGSQALTDTQLRASPVAISGTVTANTGLVQPLTDTQLRAAPVNAITQNIVTKFRDAFESYTPGEVWNETKASGDIVFVDGNAAASSYLVISKDPLTAGTDSQIESALTVSMPVELAFGAAISQRTLGQEFSVEIIDTGTPLPPVDDIAIDSITQTTTTLTVNTVLPHGLSVGKSIGIVGCSNPLANYPALVVASVPSPTQFTCTGGPGGVIASQTITNPAGAKGSVFFRERLGRAQNGISQIFENATVTNASLYIRSEAGDALPSGVIAASHSVPVGTTLPVQLVTSPYQYSFVPTTEYRIFAQADRVQWADSNIDALTQTTSRLLRTQVCPDPSVNYKLRIRATNNKSLTVPVAQIVSAVKTGTTTATITTDVPHGLVAADPVIVYGISNQGGTAFPNLTTATAVASVVNATTFTIVIGTASTVTSYGGYVAKVQGGNLGSTLGYNPIVAQNAVLTTLSDGTRQLVLTGSGSWAGLTIGDGVNLVGCRNTVDGTSLSVDGVWKVANFATTALTLVPMPGNTPPANFGSTNCGGGIIKRTELRLSFVRIFDFERQRVEMLTRPTGDLAASVPVVLQGGTTAISGSLTTVTTVTTVAAVTRSNSGIPYGGGTAEAIADVASAAITTTATTAALTPTGGVSYNANIAVTAVTGTNPTLDVSIEESDDAGTNWFKVYDFPRITAIGSYRSPRMPLFGNRIRYVQTVGGTTPSFTRVVNRLQTNEEVQMIRQLIDRTVIFTTLNSTTPSLILQNCRNIQLQVNIGAATTPPSLQLQGSDDNGVTWYNIGTALVAVASSTVQVVVTNINVQLVRATVSAAGTGVTTGYVLIKGF